MENFQDMINAMLADSTSICNAIKAYTSRTIVDRGIADSRHAELLRTARVLHERIAAIARLVQSAEDNPDCNQERRSEDAQVSGGTDGGGGGDEFFESTNIQNKTDTTQLSASFTTQHDNKIEKLMITIASLRRELAAERQNVTDLRQEQETRAAALAAIKEMFVETHRHVISDATEAAHRTFLMIQEANERASRAEAARLDAVNALHDERQARAEDAAANRKKITHSKRRIAGCSVVIRDLVHQARTTSTPLATSQAQKQIITANTTATAAATASASQSVRESSVSKSSNTRKNNTNDNATPSTSNSMGSASDRTASATNRDSMSSTSERVNVAPSSRNSDAAAGSAATSAQKRKSSSRESMASIILPSSTQPVKKKMKRD